MKRSKLGILALAAAGTALALAPAAANATTIDQALGLIATANGTVGQNVEYDFNDEDTAALYRTAGTQQNPAQHGAYLEIGDVFVGSFKFTSLSSGSNGVGLGNGHTESLGNANEVTGIYAIQVASITRDGSNWDVQFEAVNTSQLYTNDNGATTVDFSSFFTQGAANLNSDTMFKLYQDASNDTGLSADGGGFDINGPAANGDLYATAGVVDPVDTYTISFKDDGSGTGVADATGVNLVEIADPANVGRVNSGSVVRLSITDDGSADNGEGVGDYAIGDYLFPANGGDPYQVSGSVDIFNGGSFGTLSSKDSFQFQLTVVPLPAAVWSGLALMGLLGAGMVIRRRRQAA